MSLKNSPHFKGGLKARVRKLEEIVATQQKLVEEYKEEHIRLAKEKNQVIKEFKPVLDALRQTATDISTEALGVASQSLVAVKILEEVLDQVSDGRRGKKDTHRWLHEHWFKRSGNDESVKEICDWLGIQEKTLNNWFEEADQLLTKGEEDFEMRLFSTYLHDNIKKLEQRSSALSSEG
jgi:hypothetical protein